jgi:membrane-associated HD superfamily phosphohydrolase
MTSDGQPYAIGDIDAYNTEIGDLIKPLISENKAIALAKQYSGSNEEPTNYKITNDEDDRLVWDIKFSAPENKEVLIDAKTGNLISIKKTENLRQLELLNKQSYNPFLMITFFIIVVAIILVMFVFIKRMRRSGIKDSEMELNQ